MSDEKNPGKTPPDESAVTLRTTVESMDSDDSERTVSTPMTAESDFSTVSRTRTHGLSEGVR